MNDKVNIVIISGSIREGSNTLKAVGILMNEFSSYDFIEITHINPKYISLPFPGDINSSGDKEKLYELIAAADGVLFATPEYNGSFSSILKLIIENLGYPSALKDKPIAMLGVASSFIGAIKSLEHLRSVCSHIGGIVLSQQVSIGEADKVFADDLVEADTEKRIRKLARDLVEFIELYILPRRNIEKLLP